MNQLRKLFFVSALLFGFASRADSASGDKSDQYYPESAISYFAEKALDEQTKANDLEVKAVEEAYSLIVGDGGQMEWPWAAPVGRR